jgi:glutamine amidotransferase
MIVIVDYGMGNLHSVKRAINYVNTNIKVIISNNSKDIHNAQKIILPGQGGIKDCMQALNNSGLKDDLLKAITVDKKPTLGICVGMQMLFEASEESNHTVGLGILKGKFERFEANQVDKKTGDTLKVPHMGWNNINISSNEWCNQSFIWHNIKDKSQFYFIHSYYLPITQDSAKYSIATCKYQKEFISAIAFENIIATQFHPEKSANVGLQLYKNFVQQT